MRDVLQIVDGAVAARDAVLQLVLSNANSAACAPASPLIRALLRQAAWPTADIACVAHCGRSPRPLCDGRSGVRERRNLQPRSRSVVTLRGAALASALHFVRA